MTTTPERTRSFWQGDTQLISRLGRPGLNADLSADIAIVGAGIAGMSVAYMLAKAGRRVVVIDDGMIGGGNTGRTTAHLSNALDDRFTNLRRERGDEIARIAAESHGAAIDFIEQTVSEEGIACDFQRTDGYLVLGEGQDEELLVEELAAAHKAGLSSVERLSAPPFGFPDRPCLRFPRQARFNPLAYVAGLAEAVERRGGRIFCGTHVSAVEDGAPAKVKIGSGHEIRATAVVVATATPINDRLRLHTKLAPYRTYALAAPIASGAFPDALIWDTLDPYHYVRLAERDGGQYVIIGGADHKTGQAEDETRVLRDLESWARARFGIGEPAFRWSGQVMETIDGLGFIGCNPGDEYIYVVAGDSGMGMTHGTIAGLMMPALLDEGDHQWATAYAPSRKPIGGAGTYIAENANVAAQFADLVTGGDVSSFDQIAIGEGAVVRRGLSKLAIFRDDRGVLHARSAVCPHLGCIVRWNRLEKVWDCPCHGSQFDPTGRVLHGPAASALEAVEDFDRE